MMSVPRHIPRKPDVISAADFHRIPERFRPRDLGRDQVVRHIDERILGDAGDLSVALVLDIVLDAELQVLVAPDIHRIDGRDGALSRKQCVYIDVCRDQLSDNSTVREDILHV